MRPARREMTNGRRTHEYFRLMFHLRVRRLSPASPVLAAVLLLCVGLGRAEAQRGRGGPPPTPRAAAPVDLTGVWTTLVTEDWRNRMGPPVKGERSGIPLTPEGVRLTNAWDPAKDEAAGEQCRAYGAPGVMREPGRIRISWVDDTTLKIETEAGTQTRLLKFGAPAAAGEASWQGDSVASWEVPTGGGRRPRANTERTGNLKIVTKNLKPGYAQKNGVPYGANAVLTEYLHRVTETDGISYLLLTSILDDPAHYTTPFVRSTHYKKLPDTTPWTPEACSSR